MTACGGAQHAPGSHPLEHLPGLSCSLVLCVLHACVRLPPSSTASGASAASHVLAGSHLQLSASFPEKQVLASQVSECSLLALAMCLQCKSYPFLDAGSCMRTLLSLEIVSCCRCMKCLRLWPHLQSCAVSCISCTLCAQEQQLSVRCIVFVLCVRRCRVQHELQLRSLVHFCTVSAWALTEPALCACIQLFLRFHRNLFCVALAMLKASMGLIHLCCIFHV